MLRADKRADPWCCCLVQKASCAWGTWRVKLPGQQSTGKCIHFFAGQTSKKIIFPEILHYILQNWLSIPLASTGEPGHLLRSLSLRKDDFFELTRCMLPCSEVFWSGVPAGVSCSVLSAGSPGQGILALRGSLTHSGLFCAEENLGWGSAVSRCAQLRAT